MSVGMEENDWKKGYRQAFFGEKYSEEGIKDAPASPD